jgi:glycopeptide antibiotics resistance protein
MVKFVTRLLLASLCATPIYLLVRRPWRYKEKREIVLALFWLYMFGLLFFTFEGNYDTPSAMISSAVQKIQAGQGINLIPFATIKLFFADFKLDDFLVNIVANVVMFIPWGFGLPLLYKRMQRSIATLPAVLGLTAFIETFQLFICRNVDIDDVILNFLGGAIGYVIYVIVLRKYEKQKAVSK